MGELSVGILYCFYKGVPTLFFPLPNVPVLQGISEYGVGRSSSDGDGCVYGVIVHIHFPAF